MRTGRIGLFAVLLLAAICSLAPAATYVMSDFETVPDFEQWEPTGEPSAATLTRTAGHETHGTYSCRCRMPHPTNWPGMYLVNLPMTDWSAYDVLRMDFENPNSFALLLHVEISDSVQGSAWAKRYYTERTVVPGGTTVEIALHDLPRNDSTGDVDTAHIERFLFYATGFDSETDMYCDYVRLETIEDDPWADAARDIYKFDLGTEDSPRWPDFFRVTASDNYPVAGGCWGWSGGDSRYGSDVGGPDKLCRDCVRPDVWAGAGRQLDFRLDLPNSTYGVYVIARSGEWHSMPVRGWQIWAEGNLEVDIPMDASTFYSTSYYYRGRDDDYPLGVSYWERYVEPNFPAYSFTATVSDGSLDLRFADCWAYALIVYPTSESAEMTARIAGWEADRRAEFAATYYVNEPDSLTFVPTPEETARGYAAWPAPTLDPCCPDTLPPAPRPALALGAAATRGEHRAVAFAIRPLAELTDVSLSIGSLTDGDGHTIPSASITPHYVRYMATPNSEFFSPVLYWKPHLLQTDFPIAVPEQVTKQFWLEIRVPKTQEGGTYSGTVTVHTSAADLEVPLTVEVWPFELDAANEMSYGWYYMGPDERYCFKDFPSLPTAGDDMLRLDFADMKEHGFNAVQFPSPICVTIDPDTGWVGIVDVREYDRYVAAMEDTGFGGQWKGQIGTLSVANQILRHSSVTEFDANFNAAFKEVLSAMQSSCNHDGYQIAFYLVDEPRETGIQPWNRNFADTLAYCELANEVWQPVTSTVTVMADSHSGVDYTPIADETDIIQTHPWAQSAGLIAAAESQSKPIWFYNIWDEEMWDQARWGDLRFAYGFYQYLVGDGAWQWHFDWLDGEMWDPFPYSPFNNHWHYTYPSPDGPVPTLKYAWASHGITDYRYAATLDRLAGIARTSGDPALEAWAEDADALLAALLADIPAYPVGTEEHFGGVAEGSSYLADLEVALDGYREQIATLIAQYYGELPSQECEVVSSEAPDSLIWGEEAAVEITYRNLTGKTWGIEDEYALLPADGADRWGVPLENLGGNTPSGETYTFCFGVTAPPWTTFAYPTDAGLTTPAELDALPCDWTLCLGSDPLVGSLAEHEIVVSRFGDVHPGTSSEWARTEIEQCAGRIPFIVQGYSDGWYHGDWTLNRAAMAVFIARAAEYEVTPPDHDPFPDVSTQSWAAAEIAACYNHGVVQGYPDGFYRPGATITRDQMAAYLQRARGFTLPTLTQPQFADVPVDFWAAREIGACVDNDVIKGYADGFYRPQLAVNRDQMAVFVYRAFVQTTAAVVVLGGPAVTDFDLGSEILLPGEATYYGWPSASSGAQENPGWAYIAFDAERLDSSLSLEGNFTVTFRLLDSVGEWVAESVVPLSQAAIEAAKAAVAGAGGRPHLVVGWDIPGGLPEGTYEVHLDSTKGEPNVWEDVELAIEGAGSP